VQPDQPGPNERRDRKASPARPVLRDSKARKELQPFRLTTASLLGPG